MTTGPLTASILAAALLAFHTRADSPLLQVQRNALGAQISWEGGILQNAPAASGPWSSVPNAVSPLQINKPHPTTFFRVQQAYLLTVAKSGAGSGAIRSTTPGIDCGTDCSELIPSGQSVTLQSFADPGATFESWSGDGTGVIDRQVLMDAPKTVTATFSPVAAGVSNGGFEQGSSVGWQQFPAPIIYPAAQLGVAANSGQYLARLGFDPDNRRLVQIGQTITLPNSTPVYINFAAWIYSEELCDVPYYDSMNIYVAGQRIVHWDLCSNNGSNTGGWVKAYLDVSAAAGQTVSLVFEISSADALTSVLLLDDIAISNTHW
jgi:hypothetical protein